jgi:hypothetical protein
MSFETRELSGSLFPDKQDPDYEGRCKIGGVEFRISSWLNESKSGVKYMALKFKEIEPKPAAETETKQEEFVPDADIPFSFLLPASLALLGALSFAAQWVA